MRLVEAQVAERRTGRWRFAGAMLIVLLTAETLLARLALWSVGADPPPFAGWSSGGVVTLAAVVATALWCRSWRAWVAWVWLPIAVIAVTAFVLVNLTTTASAPSITNHGPSAACVATLAELEAARAELLSLESAAPPWDDGTDSGADWRVDGGGEVDPVQREELLQRIGVLSRLAASC